MASCVCVQLASTVACLYVSKQERSLLLTALAKPMIVGSWNRKNEGKKRQNQTLLQGRLNEDLIKRHSGGTHLSSVNG